MTHVDSGTLGPARPLRLQESKTASSYNMYLLQQFTFISKGCGDSGDGLPCFFHQFGRCSVKSSPVSIFLKIAEVRIRAFVDGNPDTLVIQMTAGTALELAAQLGDAAVKAKKQK